MVRHLLCIIAFFAMSHPSSFSQEFPGYSMGNYSGIHGVYLQPASIADSRYKVDVNLIGMHLLMGNTYLNFDRKYSFENFRKTDFNLNSGLTESNAPGDKFFWTDMGLYVPSFMVTLSEKHSIAVGSRARTKFHIDNVDGDLAKLMKEKLEYPTLWGSSLENSNFSIQNMSWNEYSITYARVLLDKKKHFLKAGITPKLVHGAFAFYLFADNLKFLVHNSDTLTIIDTEVDYGHSDNFEFAQGSVSYSINTKPAPALDLGVVYEWRPGYEKHKFEMDGKTDLWRRDKNKYKLRIGASLTDLGSIKFEKGPISHNFHANINNWNVQNLDFNSVESFDDTIRSRFEMDNSETHFSMRLPTALSLQVDYNVWKGFYLNLLPYYAMKFDNVPHKVHGISSLTITPRWETKWLGVFAPVSFNEYDETKVGMDVMVGPFVAGTNDILSFTYKEKISALDFHFFVRIPIYFNRIKDRDSDAVSDKLDKCRDVPGVWEFYGCPDRDGDHVEDAVDNCPDEPGSPETNGCPDRDKDGVVDQLDECPDVAGLAEFNGCPDTDGDGITDQNDRCPDKAGTEELRGCPDTDQDGIADYEDLCPEKPGPFHNLGCPETSLIAYNSKGEVLGTAVRNYKGEFVFENLPPDENIMYKIEGEDTDFTFSVKVMHGGREKTLVKRKDGFFTYEKLKSDELAINPMDAEDVAVKLLKEEEDVLNRAFADLQFDVGMANIKEESVPSLEQLAELLMKKPKFNLVLGGHTDNTGSYTVNQLLSKRRANAVKEFLVGKGINADRIEVFYFGDTKPVASNDTEEGRLQNRRVEMKITE